MVAIVAHAFILGSLANVISCAAQDSRNFLGSAPDLLMELERLGGREHRLATEFRVSRLEEVLRPMFASMAKDKRGTLPASGVRYLLHRLFVQRHAWYVTGFSDNGDSWNSSSPASVFENHAGGYHEIFQNRLSSQGFSLHQVAVLGATLEVLVHRESTERLETAYRVLGLSPSETIGEAKATELMSAYMMIYLKPGNWTVLTPEIFEARIRSRILYYYPTWPDTEKFVLEVREAVLEDVPAENRATWSTNLMLLEEITERYGRWQDKECKDLKRALVLEESHGSGRVRLEDFYRKAATHGKLQEYNFVESTDYLRSLGALDDTDPEHMSVIIANYINSPNNCMASSKFYSVCCINECEELLGTLENSLMSPTATPARIIELTSMISSSTVEAHRILPTTLVQRLEEIASYHGGRVPLHGRLFSQWMHHAYPRECPYPQLSGSTNPMNDQKAARSGIRVEATHAEMLSVVERAQEMNRTQMMVSVPWNPEEEIIVPLSDHSSSASFMNAGTRFIMCLFVLVAIASAFVRAFPAYGAKTVSYSDHKYNV